MKYYFDLLSQPSRALWMFMKLNKIPFEPEVVKLARGQQFSKSYAKINRFKMVPCIDDNGFKLSESVAIFRYLAAKHPEVADHWYPNELHQRAKVDEYFEWQHTATRLGCTGYVRSKYLNPTIKFKAPNEKKIADAHKKMTTALDQLEKIWLDDASKSFLATNEISFADVLAICEIEGTKICDYDPYSGRPNLARWQELVKKETNPFFDEAHAVSNSLIGTLNSSRFAKIWKMYFCYNY